MSQPTAKVKAKYNAKAYDRLYIFIPKGQKDKFRAVCENNGETMNSVITKAVKDYIDKNYEEDDTMVTNLSGSAVNYDAAVRLMDDELREELHMELVPCTDQEFFTAYEKAHQERFGELWGLSERNPQY